LALRLDADTVLDFVAVDDQGTDLFLQRGGVNLRVRAYGSRTVGTDDYRDQFRIETESGTWVFEQAGRYRIDAMPQRGETRVSVFVGQARFDNGTASLTVDAGKGLLVRGAAGAASYSFDRASETAFDRWAEGRDQRWDDTHQRVAAERVVSPYMTGYEDLDANGDWIDEPEYGRLWAPRVAVTGWVPYRYGSWSYVRPWGWTWIDDAPWGFAPFHYGRWVQIRTRWYWSPGRYHHRPVYAPALVSWYGDGNTSVSISIGSNIGWCPLAPREHYVPAYTSNVTYIRNINNVTNNITVINPPTRYINQSAGGTVVGNQVVVTGEPVWRQPVVQGGARIQKPLRDPNGNAVEPNGPQRWVPLQPPPPPVLAAAPSTPIDSPSYRGAPRGPAVTGEAPQSAQSQTTPNTRRPAWAVGEVARPQGGPQALQAPQTLAQPALIQPPSSPQSPAMPSQTFIEPTAQSAPITRAKPTPRPIPVPSNEPGVGTPSGGPASAITDGPNYSRDSREISRRGRDDRSDRTGRNERIERVGPTSGPIAEPSPMPPRVAQPRQQDGSGTPRVEPRGETMRVPNAASATASVKNKEGREEKTGERSERGERTPKTAPQ
jgi:hypothetical protein